jgi:hypothetical protein
VELPSPFDSVLHVPQFPYIIIRLSMIGRVSIYLDWAVIVLAGVRETVEGTGQLLNVSWVSHWHPITGKRLQAKDMDANLWICSA